MLFLPSSIIFSSYFALLSLCCLFLSLPPSPHPSLFLPLSVPPPPLRSSHGPRGDDKVMSYLRFLGMWVTVHCVPWAMAANLFVWVWLASSSCFSVRQIERRGGGASLWWTDGKSCLDKMFLSGCCIFNIYVVMPSQVSKHLIREGSWSTFTWSKRSDQKPIIFS